MKWILSVLAMSLLVSGNRSVAAPTTQPLGAESHRPVSLTATIGDLRLQIDGTLLLWTLNGVEYNGDVMGVDGSTYCTVVTFIDGKHLGASHYLDVPGRPGEVEKEDVTELTFLLDGKPIKTHAGKMEVSGKSFQMKRQSRIRNFKVDSQVDVENDVIIESVRIRTENAIEIDTLFALAFPWATGATEYLIALENGTSKEGHFLAEGEKNGEGLEKMGRWMAVYNPVTRKGGVARVITWPSGADAWMQYTDAPNAYRKQRLMSFVEQTVPAGFDGTYRMAIGFFTADVSEWKSVAHKQAAALLKVR